MESSSYESAALSSRGREDLIVHYAQLGYSAQEILRFLKNVHGFQLSIRQLYRLMKNLGVSTRREESSLPIIEEAIRAELIGSGKLLGYRSMWKRLQMKYQLSVRRDTVMALLALIDPEGSQGRKNRKLKRRVYHSKGPNFVWHCDGYDKLKPFGICIHGCIDGYSRRVMWLNTSMSNNKPEYIAYHFIACVKATGGCPQLLRTDLGTENSIVAVIQTVLRHDGDDNFSGSASHRYGKSTGNQRIEALWSHLRRQCTHWWIDFFKEFEAEGHLNTSIFYHKDAIRYCFGPLIQGELTEFVARWNNHTIRQSMSSEAPGGKPEVLYHMPYRFGTVDHLCEVDTEILEDIERDVCEHPQLCNPLFKAFADEVKSDLGISQPKDAAEASCLFLLLSNIMESLY